MQRPIFGKWCSNTIYHPATVAAIDRIGMKSRMIFNLILFILESMWGFESGWSAGPAWNRDTSDPLPPPPSPSLPYISFSAPHPPKPPFYS